MLEGPPKPAVNHQINLLICTAYTSILQMLYDPQCDITWPPTPTACSTRHCPFYNGPEIPFSGGIFGKRGGVETSLQSAQIKRLRRDTYSGE